MVQVTRSSRSWLAGNNAKVFAAPDEWSNIVEARGNCQFQKLHRSGNFCDVAQKLNTAGYMISTPDSNI